MLNYKKNSLLTNWYWDIVKNNMNRINIKINPYVSTERDSQNHIYCKLHLPKVIDTVKSYLSARTKAEQRTHTLKEYCSLLLGTMCSSGAFKNDKVISIHLVNFLLTTNTNNFYWGRDKNNNPILKDRNDNIAVDKVHSVMQKFRKNIIHHDKYVIMLNSNPVIKFYKDLHVHGELLFISTAKHPVNFNYLARKNKEYTDYLSNALKYNINAAPNVELLYPIVNARNHKVAVIRNPNLVDDTSASSSNYSELSGSSSLSDSKNDGDNLNSPKGSNKTKSKHSKSKQKQKKKKQVEVDNADSYEADEDTDNYSNKSSGVAVAE